MRTKRIGGAILFLLLLIGAVLITAVIYIGHGCHIRKMQIEVNALHGKVDEDLRNGLAGLKRGKDGLPTLPSGGLLEQYWRSALKENERAASLIADIDRCDNEFQPRKTFRKLKALALGIPPESENHNFEGNMNIGMAQIALESWKNVAPILQDHSVLNDEEAKQLITFTRMVNAIAFDLKQPLPYPEN